MPIAATGPIDAKIAIVGEFPTEQDITRGQPFCGQAGMELGRVLQEAGTSREQCFMTLVYPNRVARGRVESLVALKKKDITPKHVKFQGKWVLPEVVEQVERLRRELQSVKPNVVCAIGDLALWALTGEWGPMNWRSSNMESILVPGLKVIPTIPPSWLQFQWSLRPLLVHDLKRVVRNSLFPELLRANYRIVIRPSFEQAKSILTQLADSVRASPGRIKVGADIETRAGHISCISFAWTSLDAICIPFMCKERQLGYWTLEEETELVMLIRIILANALIVGQNWNYDAQYNYRHWAVRSPYVIDTMIQQHCCFSNLPKNLAFLSSMYLEDHLYWKDDRASDDDDTYWRYNGVDSLRTFNIEAVLEPLVIKMGMQKVFEFQQHLSHRVLDAMIIGLRWDTEVQKEVAAAISKEVQTRQQWITDVLGIDLNIQSPKQMAALFYDDLGQRKNYNRKSDGTMSLTTDDEALRTIAQREPLLRPVTDKISELRSLGVFDSTFVQAPLDIDDRMRTSFNICGTETYRFSSSKNAFGTGLNCQNIPKGGETDGGLDLPNVRKLILPDEGKTIFDIDLDSADLRIVTWESDCKWMKDHFANGRKPYVEVMREYYRNQSMTKNSHPKEYAMFKSLCHGTNYLGTADGIAPRIGLLVHETERIQKWYFGLAPEIRDWQERIKRQVQTQRFVQNAFGYRMYFFDKIEGTIFNQAVAWIPQSTVACLINRGWDNLLNQHPDEVEILLQVHDSLVGQFDTGIKDFMLPEIVRCCQVPIPYADPLVIPVGIASSERSWGDCK